MTHNLVYIAFAEAVEDAGGRSGGFTVRDVERALFRIGILRHGKQFDIGLYDDDFVSDEAYRRGWVDKDTDLLTREGIDAVVRSLRAHQTIDNDYRSQRLGRRLWKELFS